MDEAFFNQLADGKVKAISAGTNPDIKVNTVVVEAMREIGIDISRNKSKLLTLDIAENADRMITMGCGAYVERICLARLIKTEDWKMDDLHD